MINSEIIEQEIMNLEKKDTSYAVIERLAWLYIVKDHMMPQRQDARLGSLSGSEFIEACSNVSIESLLQILNEHFEVIKLVYPKEYDQLINRIKEMSLP